MAALLSFTAIVERGRGVASACYSFLPDPQYMSDPPDPQQGGSVGRGLTTDHHNRPGPILLYVSQVGFRYAQSVLLRFKQHVYVQESRTASGMKRRPFCVLVRFTSLHFTSQNPKRATDTSGAPRQLHRA